MKKYLFASKLFFYETALMPPLFFAGIELSRLNGVYIKLLYYLLINGLFDAKPLPEPMLFCFH